MTIADKSTPTRQTETRPIREGAIPRFGMDIPMPACTKPPAPGAQESSSAPSDRSEVSPGARDHHGPTTPNRHQAPGSRPSPQTLLTWPPVPCFAPTTSPAGMTGKTIPSTPPARRRAPRQAGPPPDAEALQATPSCDPARPPLGCAPPHPDRPPPMIAT